MSVEILWSLAIKGSLVLLLVGIACLFLRRASAARKHILWTAALGSLLLLPLAEVRLPSWQVSVERVPMVRPLLTPDILKLEPARAAIPAPVEAQPSAAPQETAARSFSFMSLAPVLWLAGFLGVLGWTSLGLWKARAMVKSSTPWAGVDSPSVGGIAVLTHPTLPVAATVGVLRPVILLPKEAYGWSAERLNMVLAHEMAHVRRRDWLWQLLSQVACAIHFFNPLVWLGARQLRKESEFACDDNVLSVGYEPTAYAQELLDIARRARFQFASIVGMAKTNAVESRLKAIVDSKRRRHWVSGRALIAALATSMVFAVPVAVLRAVRVGSGPLPSGQLQQPQIPKVATKEIRPGVFLGKNGIASLPNGVRVRLVGVSTENSEIWGTSGQMIPDDSEWRQGGRYWQGNVFKRWGHPVGSMTPMVRNFVVAIQSETDATIGFTSLIADPAPTTQLQKLNPIYAGADDHISAVELKANQPSYSIMELGVAKKADAAVYRVGIASGKWKTLTDIPNPYHRPPGSEETPGRFACGITLSESPVIYYRDLAGKSRQQFLVRGEKVDAGLAKRLRLFDANGKPIDLPKDPWRDVNGYEGYEFKQETFDRIARVVVDVCPYQWAEFQNVPLKPNYDQERANRLDSGIRGTGTGIAAGFSKKLSNGVTVSLEAVSRAVLEKGSWTFVGQPSWRADGQVLKNAPKIYDFRREAEVWGKNPLTYFKIRYEGAVKDAHTFAEALGDVDPTFWGKPYYPRTDTSLVDLTAAYLPSAKSGRVRVGVATGAWTTVYSEKINMAELPAYEGKTPPSGPDETGFAVFLDDNPMIALMTDKQPRPMAKKSIKGMARRLLAIMKNGEERVLIPQGHASKGVEVYGVPARHGERSESYNHILASDMKEIRLQVRPFEWVEFKGIALKHK